MKERTDIVWRVVALLGFASGATALVLALLLWNRVAATAPEARAAPQAARSAPAAAPVALAGRTATLSRILAERRAVARIRLDFGANGALAVDCRTEAADGTQAACFEPARSAGTWSLAGARLCLASAAVNLAAEACYELSGEAPNLVLSGPGLLAGNMFLR